jgi:hypothetical protein
MAALRDEYFKSLLANGAVTAEEMGDVSGRGEGWLACGQNGAVAGHAAAWRSLREGGQAGTVLSQARASTPRRPTRAPPAGAVLLAALRRRRRAAHQARAVRGGGCQARARAAARHGVTRRPVVCAVRLSTAALLWAPGCWAPFLSCRRRSTCQRRRRWPPPPDPLLVLCNPVVKFVELFTLGCGRAGPRGARARPQQIWAGGGRKRRRDGRARSRCARVPRRRPAAPWPRLAAVPRAPGSIAIACRQASSLHPLPLSRPSRRSWASSPPPSAPQWPARAPHWRATAWRRPSGG